MINISVQFSMLFALRYEFCKYFDFANFWAVESVILVTLLIAVFLKCRRLYLTMFPGRFAGGLISAMLSQENLHLGDITSKLFLILCCIFDFVVNKFLS